MNPQISHCTRRFTPSLFFSTDDQSGQSQSGQIMAWNFTLPLPGCQTARLRWAMSRLRLIQNGSLALAFSPCVQMSGKRMCQRFHPIVEAFSEYEWIHQTLVEVVRLEMVDPVP